MGHPLPPPAVSDAVERGPRRALRDSADEPRYRPRRALPGDVPAEPGYRPRRVLDEGSEQEPYRPRRGRD